MGKLKHFDAEALQPVEKEEKDDFLLEIELLNEKLEALVELGSQSIDGISDSILQLQKILKKAKEENEELRKQNAFLEKVVLAVSN